MATASQIMTAEQLLAAGDSLGRCELIKGDLRMMTPAGGRHGDITSILHYRLSAHIYENRLGKLFAAETGFILERDPDTVRAADIAFIAADRLADARTTGFIPIPPDLAVETLSPGDRASEVAEKIQWWLDHGAREAWVVDPENRTLTLHAADQTARVFREHETLDHSAALPGFALALADVFSR
jgi:Uma2 family endonuclease